MKATRNLVLRPLVHGAGKGYKAAVNTIQQVLERVSRLDEARAGELLASLDERLVWLRQPGGNLPMGAEAMIGFAKREGCESRTTENWMQELREGDTD